MNKLTRIKCEADAYELPHVAELLQEYDRLVEAIGRVSRLVQDSVHPRHGAGGCGIYARQLQAAIAGLTPESEREKVMEELVRESERLGLYTWTDKQVDNRTPLGSHAADLECLRATQEENDRLDRKLKAAELDANFNGEEVERLREELALALEWKEREQRENIRLNIALADSEKKIEELKKAGKVLVTRDTKVTIAAERIEEENKRLQSKIRTVQMELKEDGEMQDKLDKAFLEIERLETELRFPECRRLETVVGMLEDEIRCSTAREVSLAQAANAAESKCLRLEARQDELLTECNQFHDLWSKAVNEVAEKEGQRQCMEKSYDTVAQELKYRDAKIKSLQAERDEYCTRVVGDEILLRDISESIACHLNENVLRSTQE